MQFSPVIESWDHLCTTTSLHINNNVYQKASNARLLHIWFLNDTFANGWPHFVNYCPHSWCEWVNLMNFLNYYEIPWLIRHLWKLISYLRCNVEKILLTEAVVLSIYHDKCNNITHGWHIWTAGTNHHI